ncbi:tol-pal system YbgF family protein [Desulfopila sp. IMCC35008]|uniref:tetratricopeptide repeat protein n=1 Tax=Desulfopila sp. IMCC35008 TaxID=2653858 RepID=UPI0013D55270|nr:tetratricopeptide repeat protein [Desulfopila sp. IMCC35008]
MKNSFRNILLAIAVAPFLTNCASQDEVKRLQYQLHVVNKRLEEMKSTTVGDIQRRQAASSNQMDQLEREILGLKSQLDETSRQNTMLKEKNLNLEQNITHIATSEAEKREEALRRIQQEQLEKEARIAELNEKLKVQEENLQAIQDARVRDAERRAKEARRKADEAKAKALAASTSMQSGSGTVKNITADRKKQVFTTRSSVAASTTAKPSTSSTPKPADTPKTTTQDVAATKVKATSGNAKTAPVEASPLHEAQVLFDQNQFAKAYSAFSKAASANNDKDTVVTANFMMGESLFAQKEYDKAILQYQKIISQHSTHPKAASATLKQAMAFERLADNETAKMIYKKIITHYGSSPEAGIAKDKLNNL